MAARNHVADRLHALLAERALVPGDRLPPERQLAAELGVARSSLREGMRRLIDLGMLETRRGSGTYVASVDFADLLAVRLQLEPYAARLAAERRTGEQLARLDAALAELRAGEHDAAAFAAADARIHELVVEASGSPALRVLLAALADLLRHSRAATSPDPEVRAATLAHHERLVGGLHDGDAALVERTMRLHLSEIRRALDARD